MKRSNSNNDNLRSIISTIVKFDPPPESTHIPAQNSPAPQHAPPSNSSSNRNDRSGRRTSALKRKHEEVSPQKNTPTNQDLPPSQEKQAQPSSLPVQQASRPLPLPVLSLPPQPSPTQEITIQKASLSSPLPGPSIPSQPLPTPVTTTTTTSSTTTHSNLVPEQDPMITDTSTSNPEKPPSQSIVQADVHVGSEKERPRKKPRPQRVELKLDCDICTKRFNNPKLLICFHTFCRDCLSHLTSSASATQSCVKCPSCKQVTMFATAVGVDGLPTNPMISRLLDISSIAYDAPSLRCNHCASTAAQYYCLQCTKYWCAECNLFHAKGIDTKGHQVLSLEEFTDVMQNPEELRKLVISLGKARSSMCSRHDGQISNIFCETCNQLVCQLCVLFNHIKTEQHVCKPVKEAAEYQRKFLSNALQQFKEKGQEARKELERIQCAKSNIDEMSDRRVQEIDANVEELIKSLQTRREELITRVLDLQRSKLQRLDAYRMEVDQMQKRIVSGIEFVDKVVNGVDDVGLLELNKTLLEGLNRLVGSHWKKEDIEKDLPKVTFSYDPVVRAIRQFGQLESEKVELHKTPTREDEQEDSTDWEELEQMAALLSQQEQAQKTERVEQTSSRHSHQEEFQTLHCISKLEGHQQSVHAVQLRGELIFSGSTDGTVRVWDWQKNTEITTLEGHEDVVYCLQVVQEKLLTGSRDNTVRVWDLSRPSCTSTLFGHSDTVFCLDVTQDLRYLASGSADKTIRLWENRNAQDPNFENVCIMRGHSSYVQCIQIVRNAKSQDLQIVSGSRDNSIRIWDLQGKCLCAYTPHSQPVHGVRVTGDKIVSVSADATVHIYDRKHKRTVNVLRGHVGAVYCIQLAGPYAITSGADRSIRIWDLESGHLVKTLLSTHQEAVRCLSVALNYGGSFLLASGSDDRQIRVWSPEEVPFS